MVLVCSQHSSNFHCSRRKERKRKKKKKERGRERERVWFTGGVLLCRYPKAGFNKTSIWLSHRATSSKTSQRPSSPPESIFGGLWAFARASLLPQQDSQTVLSQTHRKHLSDLHLFQRLRVTSNPEGVPSALKTWLQRISYSPCARAQIKLK